MAADLKQTEEKVAEINEQKHRSILYKHDGECRAEDTNVKTVLQGKCNYRGGLPDADGAGGHLSDDLLMYLRL